ncbi:Uma2 family endonuclease [Lusitaniella coriacea]|uniref:Uma2 family endonuclease n=1 Tax=Lusitaniella coriacea TaxID=1983105 RepID=UPI003CFB2AD0
MIEAPSLQEYIPTATWVKATWEEFTSLADDPQYAEGKFYYDNGFVRIEMAALGSAHGQDNSIVSTVVVLYAALKNIPIKELTNTSFRKTGIREAQPDIGFYIGNSLCFPPRNNAPINLDTLSPPTLAIEIGATSVADDLGRKRLLYESLGVEEYWVVNVAHSEVIAFAVQNEGSRRIYESRVLPGLAIALVEEALRRAQTEDDGAIARWLMETFSS